MTEVVVLDAVSVATIARAARDLSGAPADHTAAVAVQMLPDLVAAAMRPHLAGPSEPVCLALIAYADELDEIAEAALSLDQNENEIEHQLRWWDERVQKLESELTGHPGDDVEIVRELALYRGRMSGAATMRKHYAQQRSALLARHRVADGACAGALGAS